MRDASVLKEDTKDFISNCKFDIFVALHRSYYVGVGNKESDIQATHAACKTICGLRMEKMFNGRTLVINLDVLFGKFMEITPLLPDDASKWSTQLCSSYFNALTPELRVRMQSDDFVFPALNQLNSKKDQMDALQIVKDKTSTAFKKLKDETDLKSSIIARSSSGQAHRTGNQFVTEERAEPTALSNPTSSARNANTANIILAYGQHAATNESY